MPSEIIAEPAGARSSTDLVAELRHQQGEHLLEIQRARRRRRRRTFVTVVIVVAVGAAAVVAAKIGWDRYRLQTAVRAARTYVVAGKSSELALAQAEVERGLAVTPNDADALILMAQVRAHEAAADGNAAPLDEALGAVADADRPAVVISRGVSAALAGDLDRVQAALDEVPAQDADPSTARLRAWLHGTMALGHAFDPERLEPALAEMQAVVAHDEWAPLHLRLASVLLRAGKIDDALARIEVARGFDPAALGIATDEALIHAVIAQHTGGVRDVAERLLAQEALAPRDRGRLHLARALVDMRKTKGDGVAADLDAAWADVPAWDEDSRGRIVEAALLAGEIERGQRWLSEIDPDDTTKAVYAAWVDLLQGDVAGSLEACAKLPQTHPRVAYVQALALVEQQRFTEALPWIERVLAMIGPRLELRVAEARAKAHTGDPEAAAKALREIADSYRTPRALTGLGEAQLLIAGADGKTDEAEKTLRAALEEEPRPAEAAFLLAGLVKKEAETDPTKTTDAIDLMRKATEFDKSGVRYRAALGEYLARYGDLPDAEKVLRTVADEEPVAGDVLMTLAGVALDRAALGQSKIDAQEVTAWLTKAAALGSPPAAVRLGQARLQVATADTAGLPGLVPSLAAMVGADPTNVEARLLYGETLRRTGDYSGARAILREGFSKDPLEEGRVLIARAAVERTDGNDRLAASLAYKGWLKIAELDMPANDRIELARATAAFWEDIENRPVQRAISKAVVDRVPWRADAWAFRALTQLADDQNDEGCDSAAKALKMDPDLAEAHSATAECWISKHRYPDAREELGKAVSLALTTSEKLAYKRRLRVLR